MKYWKYLEISSIVLIFIILIIVIINVPIVAKYRNNGDLIINEVVPNNKTSLVINNNHYDYIELYNGYDYDIDLEGYYLSDDNFNLKKWQFPKVMIEANSYLIVFASGLDKYENNEIHTNFKLNSKGEVLTLSDKDTNVLSKIYYLETNPDTSYGYDGSKYVYFYTPTPLSKNDSDQSNDPIIINTKSNINLKITNYSLGKVPSITITNNMNTSINLKNYYLSDSVTNKYLYKLPEVIIDKNSSIIIYLTGLNKYENNEIHTSFKLNSNTKKIVLSDNNKQEIDKIDIVDKKDKDIRINEVNSIGNDFIELKNLTNKDIVLDDYEISDNSDVLVSLKGLIIKANSYLTLYGSDTYYKDNNLYLGFHINNSNEVIYLYKNKKLVDKFNVGRLVKNVSTGINDLGEKVYYKEITLNSSNSNTCYKGYSSNVVFSIDGGYVDSNTLITLSTDDNSTIYYTLDGSFPNKNSNKYTNPIKITKTSVIKAIAYKDDYLESDIISRTFFVGRKHELPVISISTNDSNLYGSSGILTDYKQNSTRVINFEYYEANGSLGISFLGDTKLSGMDSRERMQKSMSVYLRKEYGLKEITYPFFKDSNTKTYSSFLLRNAGEDPKNIRIMDAVLTQVLKNNMDIDIQDYRPVVLYINGIYYGLYNLREKLNEDYIVTNYGLEKGSIDLAKYKIATKGSNEDYNNLVNYITSHNTENKDVYEYIKSKIDIEELINYVIVQAYYGNTDLGNIRYWKSSNNGKWRFMLYDLDWSLWNTSINFSYPVMDIKVPAATYLYSVYIITRNLYKNDEFKDLYLKTFAYHLKNTFKPDNINKLTDELSSEIDSEIRYHIIRWQDGLKSYEQWKNNLTKFKNVISARYDYVLKNIKSEFHLTDNEYKKYFGDLNE